MTGLRIREAARVILLDELDRVLLDAFLVPRRARRSGPRSVAGSSRARRTRTLPGASWSRRPGSRWRGWDRVSGRATTVPRPDVFDGQREQYFLVRTPAFEPTPRHSWEQLEAEGLTAVRWWTIEEIHAATETSFAPRRLGSLLRELLDAGPPPEPFDVGV